MNRMTEGNAENRRRVKTSLFLGLAFSFVCSASAERIDPYRVTGLVIPLTRYVNPARMTSARVIKIVDGDTIKLEIAAPPEGVSEQETIRLIGIDTPETVDPRKPVQRFGQEASDYVAHRLLDTTVYLAFDDDLRDYFGRLLAYVFLENGTCFNLELISEGYGFAYVKYPFFFMQEFKQAERAARYGKRGLWGR
jgi:micrococcal nuclease